MLACSWVLSAAFLGAATGVGSLAVEDVGLEAEVEGAFVIVGFTVSLFGIGAVGPDAGVAGFHIFINPRYNSCSVASRKPSSRWFVAKQIIWRCLTTAVVVLLSEWHFSLQTAETHGSPANSDFASCAFPNFHFSGCSERVSLALRASKYCSGGYLSYIG